MADNTDVPISDTVTYWLNQIEGAQKAHNVWYERGKVVIDRYIDEEGARAAGSLPNPTTSGAYTSRMNTLWSNVETIKPALYAKTPNPQVQRRYRDKDPVGKWGAIVLERSLDYTFDAYDVDYQIRNCVEDYLLPGRGQVWEVYEPTIEKQSGPVGADGKPTEIEKVSWECSKSYHVNWKDFLTSPARTWDEVWWVGRRVYYTKEEVDKNPKFTKGIAAKLSFTENKEDDKPAKPGEDRVKKAAIWEIWCKTTGLCYYVSKSCPEPLAKPSPPPLALEGFYPCPRPLTATTTPESIIPTPDFCFYQNQADEIDKLTQRINLLTSALRVAGLYDGSQPSLGRLLEDTNQNVMIACDTWAVLSAQGGIVGSVSFFPIADIIQALQQCYVSRDAAKQTMYEITGISDIVRGASNPKETLGAQQIKTQWGALRIRDRQAEVQRFVRDIMRLKSEIIAEHFQLETLKTMTNCPLLTQQEKAALQKREQFAAQAQQMAAQNPQMAQQLAQQNPQLAQMAQPLSLDDKQKLQEPTWEEVYALLKDQKLRAYRIDVETDSTVAADETEEKAQRTEFVTATTAFMQAWGPIVQVQPKLAPLAGELLLFASRAFKTADGLETEIENMVDMLSQQALMPQPQQPQDPKIGLEKDKMAFEREKLGAEKEKFQTESAQAIQAQQLDAQKEVAVAQAQQPRAPNPEEIQTALGPMAQIAEQYLGQLSQALMQMQQQVGQSLADNQARVDQAIQSMTAMASGPKQITVQRGRDGKISGGTVTPQMTMQ